MKKLKRENKIKFWLHVIFVGVLILLQIANLGFIQAAANETVSTEFSTNPAQYLEEPLTISNVEEIPTEKKDTNDEVASKSENQEDFDTDEVNATEDTQEEGTSAIVSKSKNSEEKKTKSNYALASASLVAQTTGSGGVKYNLYSDHTATIVYGKDVTGNYKIFASFNYNNESYLVTKIGERAFSNAVDDEVANEKITGIDFSNAIHLEEIGKEAFNYCTKLSNKIDFSNCKKLVTIGDAAFQRCSEIIGVEFGPNSIVKNIGDSAFRDNKKLGNTSVIIPDSVRNIGNLAFYNYSGPNYARVQHKTVLEMDGDLPSLEKDPPPVPKEVEGYESAVDSSNEQTTLHKAARWLDEERTMAEIRIDYGNSFDRQAKLDVIFVLDNSSSMLHPADAVGTRDQEHYKYPRSFLTNDVVNGATKVLLESQQPGYDNRVALTAFGGGQKRLYITNFVNSANGIKSFLYSHPTTMFNQTNYSAGLQGALDIIDRFKEDDRQPVVIFVSDGKPEGEGENIYGLNQAKVLREAGYRVYPIGIYDDGSEVERVNNLKNISFDGKTAYLANDSAAFQKIMEDVLEDVVNSAVPLKVKIEDILSKDFELVEDVDKITISKNGGTASVSGNKVLWNLNGCGEGVIHTLKLKVRLKPGTELSRSGILPTNDSLRAEDNSISSNKQPELDRYLAHHKFENETFPDKDLPEEVNALLPKSKGGFPDNVTIPVTEPAKTLVQTKEGQWWEFIGWDANNKTITSADVTFVGKWRYVSYDLSFIKRTSDGEGLAGAEFSLYKWTGEGLPTNEDLATSATIAEGKWQLIDVQSSQENGRVDFNVPYEKDIHYQLAETKTPDSYRQPDGQWRFTFDENGFIKDKMLTALKGPSGELPPEFEIIEEGEFTGFFGVVNHPHRAEMPQTGGHGSSFFTIGTIICFISGATGCAIRYLLSRKRTIRS